MTTAFLSLLGVLENRREIATELFCDAASRPVNVRDRSVVIFGF
jgi:hypothetical protein